MSKLGSPRSLPRMWPNCLFWVNLRKAATDTGLGLPSATEMLIGGQHRRSVPQH